MIRIKSENRTLGANLWKELDSTKMHLSGFLMIELARESRAPTLAARERERGVDSSGYEMINVQIFLMTLFPMGSPMFTYNV